MRKWLVASMLLLIAATGHGAEIPGVNLPDQIRVTADGPPLLLNGAGVRKKFFFSVYAAGLYLPEARRTAQEVLDLSGPKRVTLVMLREVSAEQFIEAVHEGLEHNTSAEELEHLRPQIAIFDALMRDVENVQTGDVVYLDYLPESGTRLTLNGEVQAAPIAGAAFYAALLRCWLGERPVDPNLKRDLLRLTAE